MLAVKYATLYHNYGGNGAVSSARRSQNLDLIKAPLRDELHLACG
jgi:hypothetical protein